MNSNAPSLSLALAVLLASVASARSQGTFVNLDFEAASQTSRTRPESWSILLTACPAGVFPPRPVLEY